MGTAMRGPGAVLWTWQVCDIALACLGEHDSMTAHTVVGMALLSLPVPPQDSTRLMSVDCAGVGVAFTELSFMLVPLTMAYFLTYLMVR